MKTCLTGLLCAAFLASGCRRDIQNSEAVRQAILDYIAKVPGLTPMDVSIGSVSYRKDEAEAQVYFRAKGGPVNNGMEMKYLLERKGNQWVVKSRAGATGGNPHGGMSTGMPMDSTHGGATPTLPPGHPPVPATPSTPPQ